MQARGSVNEGTAAEQLQLRLAVFGLLRHFDSWTRLPRSRRSIAAMSAFTGNSAYAPGKTSRIRVTCLTIDV